MAILGMYVQFLVCIEYMYIDILCLDIVHLSMLPNNLLPPHKKVLPPTNHNHTTNQPTNQKQACIPPTLVFASVFF